MQLMDFLKESTDASSKRLVLVLSGITMCIALLCVVYISYSSGRDMSNELWALTIPLCTLAGVSYTAVERMRIAGKNLAKSEEKEA